MFFSPRISTKALAELCRRLGISLEAGIDVRTVWTQEAARTGNLIARQRIDAVGQAVRRGDSLREALEETGDYFPVMFRELADVGDQTGHLGEVFAQLADHYEHRVQLRRVFLAAIAWPMTQLGLSIFIIGFLIWIMGLISKSPQDPIDPLGLGLIGNRGLMIYIALLGTVAAVLYVIIRAIRRGMVWTRPIQRAVLQAPFLGRSLQTVALARVAWSLNLSLSAGMDVRRAIRLSVQSSHNARYTDHVEQIDAAINSGNSMHDAFSQTGVYPDDFLNTLQVGEQTGRVVESMAALSRQYNQYAQTALKALTVLVGFMVWGIVALIIIALIFQLFSFYVGVLNDATKI